MVISMSGIGFTLVLFNFQTKATLITAIANIHNKRQIQMFSVYYMVFLLSLGEPPKCA